MTSAEVLAVRREVNRQRKAGITEAQIARSLTAAKVVPPTGELWRNAGIGPTWTADSVTRFMTCTRHVTAKLAKVPALRPVTAQPAATAAKQPRLQVQGVRAPVIYTSAPDPAPFVRFP